MGLLSTLKGLLHDGGLVICTPETGMPMIKSTIQLDGDVVNIVSPDALNDETVRATHFSRIDDVLSMLRRLRLGLNAPIYLLGAVATGHTALVWVEEWRSMVGGTLTPYLYMAPLIIVRPIAKWVVRKLVGV